MWLVKSEFTQMNRSFEGDYYQFSNHLRFNNLSSVWDYILNLKMIELQNDFLCWSFYITRIH